MCLGADNLHGFGYIAFLLTLSMFVIDGQRDLFNKCL